MWGSPIKRVVKKPILAPPAPPGGLVHETKIVQLDEKSEKESKYGHFWQF